MTQDRIMLITGAGRGIGAATARRAARDGWTIAINYRTDRKAAEALASDITQAGGRAIAIAADVAVEADVVRLFETVDRELGRLDVLVNNAGIVAPRSRIDEMTFDRLDRMFRVNVIGSFLCAREAVRRMSTRHGGRGGAIVNVSSAAARLGSPGEYVDYAASKGAIDTMTLGLAREVAAEGIRVNAVRPGLIDTGIHASGGQPDRPERMRPTVPMQRIGTDDEVAAAILWLASGEASYATGALLDVSGGR
jgi:NAD(P)-dependent dehydrogenase (short-subunit alcohol dehydrogenase family)